MKPRGIGAWRKETSSNNATTQTLINSNRRNEGIIALLKNMSEIDDTKLSSKIADLINKDNVIVYLPFADRDFQDGDNYLIIGIGQNELVVCDLGNLNQQRKDTLQLIFASKSKKIFSDSKETLLLLAEQGIEVNGEYFDINLAHKLLSAGLKNRSYSLHDILTYYLDEKYSGKVSLNNAAKKGDVKIHIGLLASLYELLAKLLQKHGLERVARLEFECVPTIVELERNGLLFDNKKWNQEKKQCKKENTDYEKSINPRTGRIHPNYNQIGTVTGRITCSNPNLQGVPRLQSMRSCFIPSPGNKFIIADYSQIELRIVAEFSGDETIIEAFKQGDDLHKLTALKMTNKFEDELTEKDRQAAKAVNFGLIYDMGPLKLKEYAQKQYKVDMSEQNAVVFHHMFFSTYNGIAKWHKCMREQNLKETRTIIGRRRLWADKPKASELYNAPVQGTASDIMKTALTLLYKEIKVTKVKIVGTVHYNAPQCQDTKYDFVS